MLVPLPGEPAEIAAENAPAGTGIGDRHFFPALAAPEGTADLLQVGIPGMLPVEPLAMGGAEFLSPVGGAGHIDDPAAAGTDKTPQYRTVWLFFIRLRPFPVCQLPACIGTEALMRHGRGKRLTAHFTNLFHFHNW